ncbi:MAG: hypothetical protein LUF34_08670 [Lachnospiraceae bacterium]|nr:hypothetical protein [Lachnospiraceae bacterium]
MSITFLSDLERGKPGIQLEKSIQVVNILGMDLFMEKRGSRMQNLSVWMEIKGTPVYIGKITSVQ